jgi:hypothetical protein
MMGTYSYAGACLLMALGVYFFNSYPWKGKYKLPPVVQGGLPILGNLLQLPPVGHDAGAVVKTWAEQYGEMYSPFSIQLTVGSLSNSAGQPGYSSTRLV